MADPSMKWYDPHTWLYCFCGLIGLIIGGLLWLVVMPPAWFLNISLFEDKDESET